LNCPNDVVVRRDGTIYFTDPYWKFPPGSVQELDFQGLYRIGPRGELSLEAKDFGLPNGVGLSPDEKTLYVGDTRRRKVYAFDVAKDGKLSNQRLLADLQSKEKGAVDGMKLDEKGNIYTTGPAGIWVLSPEGKHLGTIQAPEIPANCAWGGPDYQTLYLAAPKAVYRVRTQVRGKATYRLNSKGISW
jgi:gluconolactonase